jgi:hypothetical protein
LLLDEAARFPEAVREEALAVVFDVVVPFLAAVLRVLALAGTAAKPQIKAKIRKKFVFRKLLFYPG